MRFADANIFLRALAPAATSIDHQRAGDCRALLRRVLAGQEEVITSESVLADVFFVLTSRRQYGIDPATAAAMMETVVALPGLRIPERHRMLRALELIRRVPALDFADAVIVAAVEHRGIDVLSYDADFDGIAGVTRVEPEPDESGNPVT